MIYQQKTPQDSNGTDKTTYLFVVSEVFLACFLTFKYLQAFKKQFNLLCPKYFSFPLIATGACAMRISLSCHFSWWWYMIHCGLHSFLSTLLDPFHWTEQLKTPCICFHENSDPSNHTSPNIMPAEVEMSRLFLIHVFFFLNSVEGTFQGQVWMRQTTCSVQSSGKEPGFI